jgi:hypothetical protein
MRIHHLSIRVREGEVCLADDHGRAEYLGLLEQQLRCSDWRLLSYCVMPAQVCLGFEGGAAPLQTVVYPLHGEIGDLLEHAVGSAPAFASHMISFHHNEPVRARLANTAWDSPWTSHRAYLRLARRPAWLDVARGLALCGSADTEDGRRGLDEATHRRSLIGGAHWLSPEHVGSVLRERYKLSAGEAAATTNAAAAIPRAIAPEVARAVRLSASAQGKRERQQQYQ